MTLLLAPLQGAAGLSIESMNERHRALLGAGADTAPPTLLTVHAVDAEQAPALVGDALSASGMRVAHRLLDADDSSLGTTLTLGVVARADGTARLEGSALSQPLALGELYLSYEQRHWGPGWFGSLILDEAALPLAAAGWRGDGRLGTPWQWRWDLFAGTLEGHDRPRRPRLIGMRLVWQPSTAWTLGASRTLQWGGAGRDETATSLARALLGRDNRGGEGINARNEPGNQLAGFDLRYDHAIGETMFGAYAQLVGEDEAGKLPSRNLSLAGIDAAVAQGTTTLRAVVEHANTTAGDKSGVAYRHRVYEAGYAQRGRLLGHPVGGDARLTSAALMIERGRWFALAGLHRGRAQPGAQLYEPGDALRGADLAFAYTAAPDIRLGASLQHWSAGDDDTEQVRLWAEVRQW